ncbi:MAG: hypothetical protein Q8J65_04090 [Nitrosomonadales bacterium]|nr:hypothetical protein [Nitrosomonadales bacterium]
MELQVNIDKLASYPPSLIKEVSEVVLSENQKKYESVVIAEREEFVKRIEAYCDCV